MAFEFPGFGSGRGRAQSPVGKPGQRPDYQPAERIGIATGPTPSHPLESTQDRYTALSAGQKPQRRPDLPAGTAVQSDRLTPAGEKTIIHGNPAGATPLHEQAPAERIPKTLAPASRALAERALGPGEQWSIVHGNMRQAMGALHSVEQQYAQKHPLPAEVVVNGEHMPVWEYIGQWVDQIGQGTIHDIQPQLLNLLNNPPTTTLVARIVALHAAHVFFGYTAIQQAARDFISAPPVDAAKFRNSNSLLFSQLEAIGTFIQQYPDTADLVKAFFNYNVPLLGNHNPLDAVLRLTGLR